MAVSVTVAVDQSEVMAEQAVTVTATFVNDSTALTILSVDRLGPSVGAGVQDAASVSCAGAPIIASGTSVCRWKWFVPAAPSLAIYTLQYGFRLSSGTLVTPASDPQVAVKAASGFTNRERAAFPVPGSLNFLSNTQSGLLGAV